MANDPLGGNGTEKNMTDVIGGGEPLTESRQTLAQTKEPLVKSRKPLAQGQRPLVKCREPLALALDGSVSE